MMRWSACWATGMYRSDLLLHDKFGSHCPSSSGGRRVAASHLRLRRACREMTGAEHAHCERAAC